MGFFLLPTFSSGAFSLSVLQQHRSFRAIHSSVIKFVLLGLQDGFMLQDLVCSFKLEHLRHPPDPPVCDLVQVLKFFRWLKFDLCRFVTFGPRL